jgi:hypothetical protein
MGGSLSWWCWSSRPHKSVGSYAGTPCTARHGLAALDMAVSRQLPEGARDQGVSWMCDHLVLPTDPYLNDRPFGVKVIQEACMQHSARLFMAMR